MSMIITPLRTGILMAIGAGGLSSSGFETVTGLMGNWAANGIQGGAVGLLKRITDNTIDPASVLPRNHDLQRASFDALRRATTALLLEAAGRLDPRKPWVPVLADFLRQGRWRKEPLHNASAPCHRVRPIPAMTRHAEPHRSGVAKLFSGRQVQAGGGSAPAL